MHLAYKLKPKIQNYIFFFSNILVFVCMFTITLEMFATDDYQSF